MLKQQLATSNNRLVNGDFSLKLPASLSINTGRSNSGSPRVNLPYPGWQTAASSELYHYTSTLPDDVLGYNQRRCNWVRCTPLTTVVGSVPEESNIPLTAFLPTDNIMDLIGKRVTLRFLFAAEDAGQYSVTFSDAHFCSSLVVPFQVDQAKAVTEQVISFILPHELSKSFAFENTSGEHGLLISFCAAVGNDSGSRPVGRTATWNSDGALGYYTDYRFDIANKWVAFAEVEFYEGVYREYVPKSKYETEQDCAPFYLAEFGEQVCHGAWVDGVPRGFIEHGGNLSTKSPVARYRGESGWIKGVSSDVTGTSDTLTFTPMVLPTTGSGVFTVEATPVIASFIDPIVFITFQNTIATRILGRVFTNRPIFETDVETVVGINTGDSALAMASSTYTLDNKCENGNFAMRGLAPFSSDIAIADSTDTRGFVKHWDVNSVIAARALSDYSTIATAMSLDTVTGNVTVTTGRSGDNETYRDCASLVYTFKDRELEAYLGQLMVVTFNITDWESANDALSFAIPLTLMYPDGRTGTTTFVSPEAGSTECTALIEVPLDFYTRQLTSTPGSHARGVFTHGGELRINGIQQGGNINRIDTIRQPAISPSAPYHISAGIHDTMAGVTAQKYINGAWATTSTTGLTEAALVGMWKLTDSVSGVYIIVTYIMRDGKVHLGGTTSKPDADVNSKWAYGNGLIELISTADYLLVGGVPLVMGNIKFGFFPKDNMDYLRILPSIENQPLARRVSRNGAYYNDGKVPQRLNVDGRIVDTWDSPVQGGSIPQFTNPGKSLVIDANEYITASGNLKGEFKKPNRNNNNIAKLPVATTATTITTLTASKWAGKVGESALGLSFYPTPTSGAAFLVASRVCTGRTPTPIFTGILHCAITVVDGKCKLRTTAASTQAWDKDGNSHINNKVIKVFNNKTNKWEEYPDQVNSLLHDEAGVTLTGAIGDYTKDGYVRIDYNHYPSVVSGLLFAPKIDKTKGIISTDASCQLSPVLSDRLLLSEVTDNPADWIDVSELWLNRTWNDGATSVIIRAVCKLPAEIDVSRIKLYCQLNSVGISNPPEVLIPATDTTVTDGVRSLHFRGTLQQSSTVLINKQSPLMATISYTVDAELAGGRIIQTPDASVTEVEDVIPITLTVRDIKTLHGTTGNTVIPATYLWDNLSTNATRTLPVPHPAGNTKYSVVIRQGIYGALILSSTTKIKPTAPIITKQPETGLQVYQGQVPKVSIAATDYDGSADITFAWTYMDAEDTTNNFPGGTTDKLEMSTVDLVGKYYATCEVTGKRRSVVSAPANIEIMSAIPTITSELQVSPLTDVQGKNFALAVEFDEKETPVIRYELLVNDVVVQTKTTAGASFTYANDTIGSYKAKVKVINRFGETVSNEVAFTITSAAPVITKQPVPVTCVKGDATSVSLTSTSYYPQTYQWFIDDVAISDSNKATMPLSWQYTNGLSIGAHTVKATITNKYHTVTTTAVKLDIKSNAPVIEFITPPVIECFDWDRPSIDVDAKGVHNEPLTYQWYHVVGGTRTIIAGETASHIAVKCRDYPLGVHGFLCIVSSSTTHYQKSTSDTVNVTIKDSRPRITVQPDSTHHTIYQGKRLVFSTTAHAVDGKDLNYQWEYAPADGLKPVIGETTNSLNVINFVPGEYNLYCKIYTDTSFIYTNMVHVTILAADIKNQHSKIYVNGKEVASNSWAEIGTQVKFKAFCDNPSGHPLSYAWNADSTVPITQGVEITTTVGTPNNTNYSFHDATCTITNGFATAKCAMVGVRQDSKPKIKTQPSVSAGQKWAGIGFTLTTLASSARKDAGITDVVLTYNWYKGSVLIGTGATITHTEATRGTFKYKCVISNQVGSTDSAEVNVGVKQLPTIAKMLWPDPKEVFIGGDTYRWYMEVNNPDDLPLESFLLNTSDVNDESTNLTPSSAPVKLTGGRWQVSGTLVTSGGVVANHYFWMMVKTAAKPDFKLKSTAQFITFKDNHPVITTQPNTTGVTIYQGTTYNLTIAARAVDGRPLSYQWYDGNAIISGATATTFNCKSLSIGAHTILCKVSTARASIHSSSAAITVKSSAMTNARLTMTSNGKTVASASYVPIGATLVATAHVTNPSGLPLTYKWTVDGAFTTSGNTVSCKAISPISSNFNSDFACVIDNGPGSVTAPACHVRPDSVPSVIKQVPATLPNATPGQTVVTHFYASTVRSLLSGHEPMPNATYTWYEGNAGDTSKVIQAARGVNITTSNLGGSLGNKSCYDCALSVALTGAGVVKKLWCRITTLFGHCDSSVCSVKVGYPAPTWITQPDMSPVGLRQGETVTFTGKANANTAPAGTYKLSVAIRYNGDTTNTFITAVENKDGHFVYSLVSPRLGTYYCTYSYKTEGGEITVATVKQVQLLSGAPTSDMVITNVVNHDPIYQYGEFSFTFKVSDKRGPITYKWLDESNTAVGTSSVLTLDAAFPAAGRSYRCEASNKWGTLGSSRGVVVIMSASPSLSVSYQGTPESYTGTRIVGRITPRTPDVVSGFTLLWEVVKPDGTTDSFPVATPAVNGDNLLPYKYGVAGKYTVRGTVSCSIPFVAPHVTNVTVNVGDSFRITKQPVANTFPQFSTILLRCTINNPGRFPAKCVMHNATTGTIVEGGVFDGIIQFDSPILPSDVVGTNAYYFVITCNGRSLQSITAAVEITLLDFHWKRHIRDADAWETHGRNFLPAVIGGSANVYECILEYRPKGSPGVWMAVDDMGWIPGTRYHGGKTLPPGVLDTRIRIRNQVGYQLVGDTALTYIKGVFEAPVTITGNVKEEYTATTGEVTRRVNAAPGMVRYSVEKLTCNWANTGRLHLYSIVLTVNHTEFPAVRIQINGRPITPVLTRTSSTTYSVNGTGTPFEPSDFDSLRIDKHVYFSVYSAPAQVRDQPVALRVPAGIGFIAEASVAEEGLHSSRVDYAPAGSDKFTPLDVDGYWDSDTTDGTVGERHGQDLRDGFYQYKIDIKNENGTVVTTKTASLEVFGRWSTSGEVANAAGMGFVMGAYGNSGDEWHSRAGTEDIPTRLEYSATDNLNGTCDVNLTVEVDNTSCATIEIYINSVKCPIPLVRVSPILYQLKGANGGQGLRLPIAQLPLSKDDMLSKVDYGMTSYTMYKVLEANQASTLSIISQPNNNFTMIQGEPTDYAIEIHNPQRLAITCHFYLAHEHDPRRPYREPEELADWEEYTDGKGEVQLRSKGCPIGALDKNNNCIITAMPYKPQRQVDTMYFMRVICPDGSDLTTHLINRSNIKCEFAVTKSQSNLTIQHGKWGQISVDMYGYFYGFLSYTVLTRRYGSNDSWHHNSLNPGSKWPSEVDYTFGPLEGKKRKATLNLWTGGDLAPGKYALKVKVLNGLQWITDSGREFIHVETGETILTVN